MKSESRTFLKKVQLSTLGAGETILMTGAGIRDIFVAFGSLRNSGSASSRQGEE